MARTRQQNLSAAQWSPNGGALGAPDLTAPENQVFGANVFSPAVQRQRLPKAVYRQLQSTLERGEALDPTLADAVRRGMKDWALEKGATHYTHWFQPLTGSTAEKHDSFFAPAGDGTALTEFSGKELIQGEPDASSFPTGGIRATFEARGYTAWDPTSPAFIIENPNGAVLCIPTAFASWTGEALDHKIPLLRSMDALSRVGDAAPCGCSATTTAQRVFTTVGPEQEYFLIDEQYYYERPDLINTGRTLFGAKPPKGHELDDHYFGSIPERILACMLEVEVELAKLGVPIKTRHNEVAPAQYEVAPIFENSNVGSDHQQLTMQVLQRVARKYGLVCLLHEKPFAGRQRLGQAQQLVDGHRHRATTCSSPATRRTRTCSSCSSRSAVIQAVNKHQGLLRASVANAGQDHRLGANEAPPAIISIFLGAELLKVFEAIEKGEAGESTAGLVPRPGHAGAAAAADARRRPQPDLAVRLHRQQVRVPRAGLEHVAVAAEHGAEHDRRRGDRRARPTSSSAAASDGDLEAAVRKVVQGSYGANKRIVLRGRQLRRGVARGGRAARAAQPAHDARRAAPAARGAETIEAFGDYGVLSERELESRYEVFVEQYAIKINIEAETAADIARTMILPAALRHRAVLDAGGRPTRAAAARSTSSSRSSPPSIEALEEANVYPGRSRGPRARDVRPRHADPGDGARPRGRRPAGARGRRRPLAAAEVLGDPVRQVGLGLGGVEARRL